ncbi:hypothetical protein [Microbacterium sp.]|uniref:hypothetical protein n=1 Tax=Microbacterium sp. TaxID=51671 RepID=UPI003F6F7F0D
MTDTTTAAPVTLDDIANIVRLLAITTRDDTIRPHGNLIQHSLIHQLRTNITPDGDGGLGGRGKPANERSPINAAALTLYEFLVGRIGLLFEQGTGRTAKGSPEELLVAWYVELAVDAAADEVTQLQFDQLHAKLDDWRTRIMDHFYPPERAEIPYACPECGWKQIHRTNADGIEIRQYALVGFERDWRDEEGVKCRSCNVQWVGRGPMLELAADLGIDLTAALNPPPKPVETPAPIEPLWLCMMTAEQAKDFAKTNEINPASIVIASKPSRTLRTTTRPIRIATTDAYTPGPHEWARALETQRVAQLVNAMNGYTADGQPKPEETPDA